MRCGLNRPVRDYLKPMSGNTVFSEFHFNRIPSRYFQNNHIVYSVAKIFNFCTRIENKHSNYDDFSNKTVINGLLRGHLKIKVHARADVMMRRHSLGNLSLKFASPVRYIVAQAEKIFTLWLIKRKYFFFSQNRTPRSYFSHPCLLPPLRFRGVEFIEKKSNSNTIISSVSRWQAE